MIAAPPPVPATAHEIAWLAELADLLDPDTRWQPHWYQAPPDAIVTPPGRENALSGDVEHRRDWKVWFLKAGRGTGKTDAGAHAVDDHAMGPPCFGGQRGHRIAVVAPTSGVAREVCVEGETGLLHANPRIRWNSGKGTIHWPNGARGQTFSSYTYEDAQRLRGPQHCLVWFEEAASARYLDEAWNQIQFGLRLGPRPRVIITSTPKPRKQLRAIEREAGTVVVRAMTMDNPSLSQAKRDELQAKYGGTRLGRQELNAEDLDDVPGALWTHDETAEGLGIIRYRAAPTITRHGLAQPNLARVIVAIDPNVSSEEGADEAGITVHGLGYDRVGYLLADRSAAVGPTAWAKRAMEAASEFGADSIVAEANNGGEMVRVTLEAAGYKGRVILVHASRGKRTRAEPVSMLYEQQRIFHCELFPELEEQMTTWTPESGESPDRLDANVWGWTELLVDPPATVTSHSGIPDSKPQVRVRGDLVLRGKRYVDKDPVGVR